MIQQLTPGKRYRWTAEGTAEMSEDVGLMLAVSDSLGMSADLVACGTLELLPDPLPTAPGSVVTLNGHIYGATCDDPKGKNWIGLSGRDTGHRVLAEDLREAIVLFDARAGSNV